ncbi:hypothetical protein RBB78_17060 [Tunturiibacter empetritectus]|uniref:hypothetical protein n=1 Tax=Tunturiibacter empetritectus TaxID=3069691 RepID=UPI003D9AC6CA
MVLTSGEETVAMGNWPGAMEPVRRRVWVVGSCGEGAMTSEEMPGPGMKVEKTMPSPAGVSLVRKPEVAERRSGMMAERVG